MNWERKYLELVEPILDENPFIFDSKNYTFGKLVDKNLLHRIFYRRNKKDKATQVYKVLKNFIDGSEINTNKAIENFHLIFIVENPSLDITFNLDDFKDRIASTSENPEKILASLLVKKNNSLVNNIQEDLNTSNLKTVTVQALDNAYWEELKTTDNTEKKRFLEEYYFKADSRYAHHAVVFNEINNTLENHRFKTKQIIFKQSTPNTTNDEIPDEQAFNFYEFIENTFENRRGSSFIEFYGPSGSGKTHILAEAAHYFSFKDNYEIYKISSFNNPFSLDKIFDTIHHSSKRIIFILENLNDKNYFIHKYESEINQKDFLIKEVLFIGVTDQTNLINNNTTPSKWKHAEILLSEVNYNEVKIDFFNLIKSYIKLSTHTMQQLEEIWDDNWSKKYTVRELIFTTVQLSGISSQFSIYYDWDLFNQITDNPVYRKFKDLYSFVALFSNFGISVPLETFDYKYIYNLDRSSIRDFINDGHSNHTLKIIENKEKNNRLEIDLRHKDVAKWYFSIQKNIIIGRDTINNFLNTIEAKLKSNLKTNFINDEMGSYLLRNIYRYIKYSKPYINNNQKYNEFRNIPEDRIVTIFQNYKNYLSYTENEDEISKIIYELVKLEKDFTYKIIMLDELINSTENNYRAIHQKVNESIKNIRSTKNRILANDIEKLILENIDTEGKQGFLNSLLDIDLIFEYSGRNYISLVPKDYDILLGLAKQVLYKYKNLESISQIFISKAFEILNYIKENKPSVPLSYMVLAEFYIFERRYDLAESELKEILKLNELDIHARVRLAQCYMNRFNQQETEDLLNTSIALFPHQPALYVLFAKYFRTIGKYKVNKSKNLLENFEKASIEIKGYSYQLWTERAKWLIETENTFESHIAAEKILRNNIRQFPFFSHSRTELGLLYQLTHLYNIDESIKILEKAITISEDEVPKVVLAKSYIKRGSDNDWRKAKSLSEEVYSLYFNRKLTNRDLIQNLVDIYKNFKEQDKLEQLDNRINNNKTIIYKKFEEVKSKFIETFDLNDIRKFLILYQDELYYDSILYSEIGYKISEIDMNNEELLEMSFFHLQKCFFINNPNPRHFKRMLVVLGKIIKFINRDSIRIKYIILFIDILRAGFQVNGQDTRFLNNLKDYHYHYTKCYRKALKIIDLILVAEGYENKKENSIRTKFLIYNKIGNIEQAKQLNRGNWIIYSHNFSLLEQDLKGFFNSKDSQITLNVGNGNKECYEVLPDLQDNEYIPKVISPLVTGDCSVYFAKILLNEKVYANFIEPAFTLTDKMITDDIINELEENKKRFENFS